MAAEVVQHGRRKGSMRSPGASPAPIDRASKSGGERERVNPSQIVVVPGEEWERIQASLSSADRDAELRRTQIDARTALRDRSKAIVKNWENTIEGQRLKKLQARKLREEKEEAERVCVDAEEAKFQAERRKEAIERAKTLLYHQTDRVKQFHGALLLSEVLRERDAQVEYKKHREERVKQLDQSFLQWQQEERECGVLVDMKAAEERAKARDEVAHFQLMQKAEKDKHRRERRAKALEAQAQLEREVAEFHSRQREVEERVQRAREELHGQLDASLADKEMREGQRRRQEEAEDESIRVFAEAKKKMTRLRKEKERELFEQFQSQQQQMCVRLQDQMAQRKSDEDERIAKAVTEQEAKREREEREKEAQFLAQTREIHVHRREMITEREGKAREQAELDQQLLQQRVVQDQKFHAQQLDRQQKAAREMRELREFRHSQVEEQRVQEEMEKEEEKAHHLHNMALLKVEEEQFQDYAGGVLREAEKRGPHTQPLRKAAKAGAGGGHGPVFSGKGGIRPSYQAMDSTAVELPSYQPRTTAHKTSTQKRMGFTW